MDGHQYHETRFLGTLLGISALAFWSTSPLCVAFLKNIPVLQILATAMSICFILIATKISWQQQWPEMKQSVAVWMIGIMGIYGSNLFYLAAFKYAPPAHVTLINYTWPLLTIFLSSFLPTEQLTGRHIIAALIAFVGLFILVNTDNGINHFQWHYLIGYGLALGCSTVWSIYCVACKFYEHTKPEFIGLLCGVGALISLTGHLMWETTVAPSLNQWLIMLFMGLTVSGPAFMLWDKGMKLGNLKFLCIISFAVPITSIILLILFGHADYSHYLILSACLVALGGLVGSELRFRA